MKTKVRTLRWLLLLLLLAGGTGVWAQTSQTLTQDVCPGSEPYLVTPHGGSTYQWTISPPGGWSITNPNSASTNVIWSNPAVPTTYLLSLTETNGSGCDSVVSVSVTVHPQVLPTFTQLGPFCENSTPPALPNTSIEGITGTWSPATITTTVTGPTTYTFTPNNASQCGLPTTMVITITPQVLPTFTQLGPFCENSTPPALPNTSIEGITGTWSPATITTTVTGPTTYTFTPNNASQCGLPTTMVITITPAPVPTINCHPDICLGTAGDVFSTEAGMSNYIWTVSAGGTITNGGNSTSNTVTITWTGTGPQSVSINYSNASNCPGLTPASCSFNVNGLPATSPIFHN
jgi:hypothetical protein